MSDLKQWAMVAASEVDGKIEDCVPHQERIRIIQSAILRGMVEALEAEPDEGMLEKGDFEAFACEFQERSELSCGGRFSITAKRIFRAMAAARAKELK